MIFQVKNGCFRYNKKEDDVLSDVNFDVKSGEILAVLGPNGAGKTTLLRCALGFLKFDRGEALFDGKNVRSYSPSELWRKVAYVPQARQTISPYTVEETVLLGRSSYGDILGRITAEDYKAADEVIEKLNLERIRHKNCSEISGGELQMVLIARALAVFPELLVLDEPESNLDFRNQLLVLDTLTRLAKNGTGIILNTHYPAHALRRADKALMLGKDGSSEFGRTQEVVTSENIGRFFGVNAVIGEIETDTNHYIDVIPVDFDLPKENTDDSEVIATLSVIMKDNSVAQEVNAVIHKAFPFVLGRMGMPVRDEGLYIINLVLKASPREIRAVLRELNEKSGVSVKAVFERR